MIVFKRLLALFLCGLALGMLIIKSPITARTLDDGAGAIGYSNAAAWKILTAALTEDMNSNGAQKGLALLLDTDSMTVVSAIDCTATLHCSPSSGLHEPWEPGSSLKPFIIAACIDVKACNDQTKMQDNGSVFVGGRIITNYEANQPQEYDLPTILAQSRNTGAVNVLKALGNDSINQAARETWTDYLHERLHISGEAGLYMVSPHHQKDSDYRFALSSFGVGITTTPLKLAQAYAVFSNAGIWCDIGRSQCARAFDESTVHYVRQILTDIAYTSHGMSQRNGVAVGGKSGTAPVADQNGVYEGDAGVYVGFIEDVAKSKHYVLLVRYVQPNENPASAGAKKTWKKIVNELVAA